MVAVKNKERFYSTDRDLENRIRLFLYLRNVPNHDSVDVHAENGTVLVEGRLPSRLVHWLSLQCCLRVAGVVKLIDRTEVTRPAESSVPRRKTPVGRPTGDSAD